MTGHVLNNFLVVGVSQSDEHEYALVDVRDGVAFDLDPSLENSLENYAHVIINDVIIVSADIIILYC